ncbi:MAG: HNH endonuclease [Xenococcaceae cyanobacterium]
MPINKTNYHPNWNAIALNVKDKAGWICSECGRPCKRPKESWDEFKYRLSRRSKKQYMECCDRRGRFVLTTAHLNHNTKDNRTANLKAMCSVCHLRYDAKYHAKNAARTRSKKRSH